MNRAERRRLEKAKNKGRMSIIKKALTEYPSKEHSNFKLALWLGITVIWTCLVWYFTSR